MPSRAASRAPAGTRVADVLAALSGAFDRKGWHGPSVLDALRGVTAREANQRPGGVHHSIHQLVDHIQYWEEAGLRYATERDKPRRTRRDWGLPETPFGESLRRLRATHARLLRAVSRLEDAQLERPIGTWDLGKMPLHRVLHGVAAHAAYHAGQIRLIRTLL
jgi:uncharacterized damage-inducible protein DinB